MSEGCEIVLRAAFKLHVLLSIAVICLARPYPSIDHPAFDKRQHLNDLERASAV